MVKVALKSLAYATDGKWNLDDPSTWVKENYPLDNTWNYVFHLTHTPIVTKIRTTREIYEFYEFFYQKIFGENKELLVSFGKVGFMVPGIPTGPLFLHQDFSLPKFDNLPDVNDVVAWRPILLKIQRVQGVIFCTTNDIEQGNFICVPKSHKDITKFLTYFLNESPINPKSIQYSPKDKYDKIQLKLLTKKEVHYFSIACFLMQTLILLFLTWKK